MTEFVSLEDALHVAQRMGFRLRDPGLLAAALARPATTVYGAEAYPLFGDKAAALMESVARNHPFVDGNKRSAWTLTVIFLWLNSYVHDASTDEAFDFTVAVAEGRLELADASAWWQSHLIPRQSP